jgi:hypothetical protein
MATAPHRQPRLGRRGPVHRAAGSDRRPWRDGPLEDIHAGVGRPGGIADADMMLGNVVTSRLVAGTLGADG